MSVAEAPPERGGAELRRAQILKAAEVCFRKSGFHAASMAEIAAEARLSVGQIYRYFTNKEAIVGAIVERDLHETLEAMDRIEQDPSGIRQTMVKCARSSVERLSDPDRAALMLEVMAEAGHNPRVAAVVQAVHQEFRRRFFALISKGRPKHWTDADVAARVELLTLMFDSVPLRAVQNPDFDRAELAAVMETAIGQLLSVCRS